ADKIRKEKSAADIKIVSDALVKAAASFGSIDKRKDFKGDRRQWQYVKLLQGRLKEAQEAYETYKLQEVKTEEMLTAWKNRSPNLFKKIDNVVNAANEPVDMMIGVKNLFDKNDNGSVQGGYNEVP